jgi:1-acyl-sn-glycerol-3-phosphate acyltransferase
LSADASLAPRAAAAAGPARDRVGGSRSTPAQALALAALVGSAAADLLRHRVRARLGGATVADAASALQRWSRRAWPRLGLAVEVVGAAPDDRCLYVANHRSYLDVPLLAGVLGATFLSRADVAAWPLVGAAARAAGVVFVERTDAFGRALAARALLRRVRQASVIVFPEGTTTGARLPAPFHSGLFHLLRRLDVAVVPVTVRYGDPRAYWTDEIGLAAHLRRVLAAGPLRAVVHVGARLPPDAYADGETLTRAAWRAVARPIEECGEIVPA